MIRYDTVKHAEAFECGDPTRVEPNRKPKRTRPQSRPGQDQSDDEQRGEVGDKKCRVGEMEQDFS